MLIAKGYRVVLRSATKKKTYNPPKTSALLHDPEGKDWPACSGLIAGFRRERLELDPKKSKPARDYFNYEPNGGAIHIPPKALSHWRFVDTVDWIEYTRPGDREGKGKNLRYDHEFKEPQDLYRMGRLYRLELRKGCVWNWRGIVTP